MTPAKTNDANEKIQQQLIEARRNQILDAATKIFAEKGFQRATIKEVAREAGIADGTVYIYFENKTALILGILDRLNESDQREADFERGENMDLETFFQAYMEQRFAVMTQGGYSVLQALLPEVLVNAELRELYYTRIVAPTFEIGKRHLTHLIEQGKIKPVDPHLLTAMISSAFLGIFVMRLLGDEQIEARQNELPALFTKVFFEGLKPKSAQEADHGTSTETQSNDSE